MNSNAKIYVAGHRAIVGSAIMRWLAQERFANLLVCFNTDMPDGTPCKLLYVSRLTAACQKTRINLAPGLWSVYQDFLAGAGKNLHLA